MLRATFKGFALHGSDCTEQVLSWSLTGGQLIDSAEIVLRPNRLQRDRLNLWKRVTIQVSRTHASELAAAQFIKSLDDALEGLGTFQLFWHVPPSTNTTIFSRTNMAAQHDSRQAGVATTHSITFS